MSTLQEQYPIVLSQKILWGDMDAFEHVNNTVYFRYFEDARMAYFEKLGVPGYMTQMNVGPILAATNCNFKLPLNYPDYIQIAVRSKILSSKKIQMEYLVYSENFEAIAAEGEGLIVYYDYKHGKSCEIPEQIVAAINEIELV